MMCKKRTERSEMESQETDACHLQDPELKILQA